MTRFHNPVGFLEKETVFVLLIKSKHVCLVLGGLGHSVCANHGVGCLLPLHHTWPLLVPSGLAAQFPEGLFLVWPLRFFPLCHCQCQAAGGSVGSFPAHKFPVKPTGDS